MKPWLILTLIATALLYGLAVDSVLDLNGDSPRFVMLARSLHDGQGYVARFDIEDHAETQIPYLYPLLLLPFVSMFGPHAYAVFKLLSVACMVLAIYAMWFWLSQWTSEEGARWVTVAAAFLAQLQFNAIHIATEAPFLAASFACLGFMEKAMGRHARGRDWVFVFMLIGVCFHLRAAAWALPLTLVFSLLLAGLWRKALASGVVALLVCVPWLARVVEYGFGYSAEFERNTGSSFAFFYRMAYNTAADITKSLPDLFLYPFLSSYLPYERLFFLKAAIGVTFFILMARGLWLYAEKRHYIGQSPPSALYLIVYLAGALAWTVHGERYLLPVLPILLLALMRGADPFRKEVMALVIAIGVGGCFAGIYHARTGTRPPEEAGFVQAAGWLKRNAPDTDRVMSRFPTWVAADNGQRGERFDESFDPEVHRKTLLKDNIRWLVVDYIRLGRITPAEYLAPLLEKYPDEFELQFQSRTDPQTKVYRFKGSRE